MSSWRTTADGTAKAGTDYVATSGIAVVPAGSTSVDVAVDTLVGATPGSTFSLDLDAPYSGVVTDAQAMATITGTATSTTTSAPTPTPSATPRFTG
jgi:endoglucanase